MEAGYMETITHWSDQIWPLVAAYGSSGVLIFRFELRRPDATFNKGRSRSSSGAVVACLYLRLPVGECFPIFPMWSRPGMAVAGKVAQNRI